jgi:hypothetical protein
MSGEGMTEQPVLGLHCGEIVEVRCESEILKTLDIDGAYDGLPFMPEMLKFCGQRFKVFKRADKVCVEGYGLRRLANTVLLEQIRCDGAAHEGCQRACLIFWKEVWLKRSNDAASVQLADQRRDSSETSVPRDMHVQKFSCQATELSKATFPLRWWDVRQYISDIRFGNLSLSELSRSLRNALSGRLRKSSAGWPCSIVSGEGTKTPEMTLNLRPGELVEIKRRDEILATLDDSGRNRGLEFSPEMLKYCGQRFRVLNRIENIILEMNGRMQRVKNTVILQGVTCDGMCHRGCPRNNYVYWREIWLRRVT